MRGAIVIHVVKHHISIIWCRERVCEHRNLYSGGGGLKCGWRCGGSATGRTIRSIWRNRDGQINIQMDFGVERTDGRSVGRSVGRCGVFLVCAREVPVVPPAMCDNGHASSPRVAPASMSESIVVRPAFVLTHTHSGRARVFARSHR